MKKILLFMGLSLLTCLAHADDFGALNSVYKNQATIIKHAQQEDKALTMAMIDNMRQESVIKMPFYEQQVSVETPLSLTSSPQQVTNIYLPPEQPSLWDNIKATVPQLLVKSIFLAL